MREITDKKELERLMGKSPKGTPVEPIPPIPRPEPGDTPLMKAAKAGITVGSPDPACLRDVAAPCLRMVPVEDVVPTPDNPRKRIDTKAPDFLELVESVKALGILQPLVARPHPTQAGKLDLRAGHRRHEAARAAGLAEVPVMVREMSDRVAMEVTVLENLQRVDLTPMEEARLRTVFRR